MSGNENPLSNYQQKQQARQASAQGQEDSGCQCSSCGTVVSASADICENCGQWLLEGKCCFCYAEVKPGQKFCRECGNPPTGITCPQCNTLSKFDFCPTCSTPLSKRSKPYLESLQQSAAFKELIALSELVHTAQPVSNDEKKDQEKALALDALKVYMQQFEKLPDQKKLQGFSFNSENTDATDALKSAAKEDIPMQAPETKGVELELMKKIALLQQQTFTDNQSARLFYTAIKVLLPVMVATKHKRLTGWLCNFANVVHAAPHECSEPNLGGEWQYETETAYETTYSEH